MMIGRIEDDFVKIYRIRESFEALERVKNEIGERIYERLRSLLEYRLYGKEFDRSPLDEKIVLAFSMGSDSTASLKILRWAGFNVVPVMVKLPQIKMHALNYDVVFVEIPGYMEVMNERIRKKAPICGVCHSMIMEAVEKYARENKVKIVASGDLLSSGLVSIYQKGDITTLNLPAFLAMDKREVIGVIGGKYTLSFGCPLWKTAAKNVPVLKRFAIQRVLRELRARVIDEEIALTLIYDILQK